MSAILKFIRPFDLFDSPTLVVLGEAYNKAILNLRDRGQPNIVHEVIAIRTFDLAAKGERHIDRLCAGGIGRLRVGNFAARLERPRIKVFVISCPSVSMSNPGISSGVKP